MRPWKRLIADVLLDAADLAERAAKMLREEPEPDDLRRRVAELEQHQEALREWARAEADYSDLLAACEEPGAEADYSEWCEVPGSASQASLGDRLRADRRNAARKAGGQ